MNYAMDAAPGEWQLTDYVRKGIELLDNSNGFFMMVESGKIDWACTYTDFEAACAAAAAHGGYPVFYNGTYRVRIGSFETADAASASSAAASGSVVSGGSRGVLVVKARSPWHIPERPSPGSLP